MGKYFIQTDKELVSKVISWHTIADLGSNASNAISDYHNKKFDTNVKKTANPIETELVKLMSDYNTCRNDTTNNLPDYDTAYLVKIKEKRMDFDNEPIDRLSDDQLNVVSCIQQLDSAICAFGEIGNLSTDKSEFFYDQWTDRLIWLQPGVTSFCITIDVLFGSKLLLDVKDHSTEAKLANPEGKYPNLFATLLKYEEIVKLCSYLRYNLFGHFGTHYHKLVETKITGTGFQNDNVKVARRCRMKLNNCLKKK